MGALSFLWTGSMSGSKVPKVRSLSKLPATSDKPWMEWIEALRWLS